MKKTIISLTDRQMKIMKEEAESLGISKAELLRRILDKYIDSKNVQKNIMIEENTGTVENPAG